MRVVVAASDQHLATFQNAIAALGGNRSNLPEHLPRIEQVSSQTA